MNKWYTIYVHYVQINLAFLFVHFDLSFNQETITPYI